MSLTIKNIEISDIKAWGHSDGYDECGNFTSSHRNIANLMIKGRGLIIPMVFYIRHGFLNPNVMEQDFLLKNWT